MTVTLVPNHSHWGAFLAEIEQQAKRMRAPLFAAGESWHVNVEHGRLVGRAALMPSML